MGGVKYALKTGPAGRGRMTRRTTDRHTCVRVPTRIGGYGSNYKIVSSMDAGRDFRIRVQTKETEDRQ